jgi:drug/metabolite transporter (DMT)-like permease
MQQIHGECGFEIHRENDEVLLVNRRTWRLGYGAGMLGLLGAMAAVVGVLVVVGAADVRSDLPAIVLLAMAVACGLVAAAMLSAYGRRRRLPLDEVADAVVVDRAAGVLRERCGNVIAPLDSLKAAVRIDWWTRGWMRLVVLAWPGGRRTVYRSGSRQRARVVAESLRDILSP